MRRSAKVPERCPKATHELLELLTRPWTMHILWALSTAGPTRFGVLRRKIEGVSSRVLSLRLRSLEEKGFIDRHYEPTIPPAVTYSLTERLEEIKYVLDGLDDLAHKWQDEDAVRKAPLRKARRATGQAGPARMKQARKLP